MQGTTGEQKIQKSFSCLKFLLPESQTFCAFEKIHLLSRRPACTSYGLGTEETLLNINMLADKKKDDYCGVFINEKLEERSVAVAVIICKTNMYPQKAPVWHKI